MTLPVFSPFDKTICEFSVYADRFEEILRFNNIPLDKYVSAFITAIGDANFQLLVNLTTPGKPTEKTYPELREILTNHFEPFKSEILEAFKFFNRFQDPAERVNSFMADLKKLSTKCNFETYLEKALRNQFVNGLHSRQIRESLLQMTNLNYKDALELAKKMEETMTPA